jgi:FkbM family methyltransferase
MKTFLEIGSCDFDNLNYLSHYGWKGVIVEPIAKYLDNIIRLDNVQYINAAITEKDGVSKMYTAPEDVTNKDPDFRGMSSLIKNSNDALTKVVEVKTMSFDTLLSVTGITQIDYLKIDTEGYDSVILKSFPWDLIQPKYIKFESRHIDVRPTLLLLEMQGYHCEVDSENTYAFKI